MIYIYIYWSIYRHILDWRRSRLPFRKCQAPIARSQLDNGNTGCSQNGPRIMVEFFYVNVPSKGGTFLLLHLPISSNSLSSTIPSHQRWPWKIPHDFPINGYNSGYNLYLVRGFLIAMFDDSTALSPRSLACASSSALTPRDGWDWWWLVGRGQNFKTYHLDPEIWGHFWVFEHFFSIFDVGNPALRHRPPGCNSLGLVIAARIQVTLCSTERCVGGFLSQISGNHSTIPCDSIPLLDASFPP